MTARLPRARTSRDGESFGNAVYAALKQAITDGSLKPNDRLREAELSKRFKVSRTPIREALKKLEADELVVNEPGRGVVVAAPTRDDVFETYELREHLASFAARLAAVRAEEMDLIEMQELARRCQEAISAGDEQRVLQLSAQFDRAIYGASKNRRLAKILSELQHWQHGVRLSTLLYPGRPKQALAEHRSILEAIQRRDANKAEELEREHVRHSRDIRIRMDVAGEQSQAHAVARPSELRRR